LSHYDILEVSPKASVEVIRAAYKSLMQRNHPDKNADVLESTARASLIAQAYDVLSDPERRRSYDDSLLQGRQAEEFPGGLPHGGSVSQLDRQRSATTTTSWRTWYATTLIVSIICAGTVIFVLSKRPAAPALTVQEPGPSVTRANETQVMAIEADRGVPQALTVPLPRAMNESAVELQARTISSFVTDLSIELTPTDPAQSSSAHVLHIPNLGLRFLPGESDRLAQRVADQRSVVIQQLLTDLTKAEYRQLIRADGDLYLKKLIEEAVCTSIGLEKSAALSTSAQSTQGQKLPVEALMPLSFSVR
jgi:curved DNA-binding protein CbpA